jgi:hypothetical protein
MKKNTSATMVHACLDDRIGTSFDVMAPFPLSTVVKGSCPAGDRAPDRPKSKPGKLPTGLHDTLMPSKQNGGVTIESLRVDCIGLLIRLQLVRFAETAFAGSD